MTTTFHDDSFDEPVETAEPTFDDPYAQPGEEAEGPVYTAMGADWDEISAAQAERGDSKIVVNMGPQHPSTHGVLRFILELDGETVTSTRVGIGFLHTGIEKSCEYRTWTQGSTLVTRMDYLTSFFNECTYVMGVERLLGLEDQITQRTKDLRILLMELNRISNHLVCIGTAGNELGATTVMTVGFREREMILDAFEMITGLRMNHGYFRPGGVAVDLPDNGIEKLRELSKWLHKHLPEVDKLCTENPLLKLRMHDIAHLDAASAIALGVTGPPLKAAGVDWDLRKTMPYLGYETYDFDTVIDTSADAFGRYRVRLGEMFESLKIVDQAIDRLEASTGERVMVEDPKIAWPAQLTVGPDGQGNSHEHIKHIMGESMEALIHHFKIITEGFRVPAGQAYVPVESPKGEQGAHVVSDGGNRPFRVHFRDPSFVNLQSLPIMTEGAMLSDVIVAGASLDPVMGGVDR